MSCRLSLALGLFCFCFVFVDFAYIKGRVASLDHSSISMRPGSPAQLPNDCLCPLLFMFTFCFFGEVPFSGYSVSFPFPLCMESTLLYVSFRVAFFYLVTTGWILTSAYARIQSINPSIFRAKFDSEHIIISSFCRKGYNTIPLIRNTIILV